MMQNNPGVALAVLGERGDHALRRPSRPLSRRSMYHRGRDGPAYVDWVEQNLVLLAELTNAPRPTSRSVRRNKLTARPLIGARSGRLAL
jgi:hypothetical protein